MKNILDYLKPGDLLMATIIGVLVVVVILGAIRVVNFCECY